MKNYSITTETSKDTIVFPDGTMYSILKESGNIRINSNTMVLGNNLHWWYNEFVCMEYNSNDVINFPNGRIEYRFEGKLHAINGPAVIDPTGTSRDKRIQFWIYGEQLKFEEFIGKSIKSADGLVNYEGIVNSFTALYNSLMIFDNMDRIKEFNNPKTTPSMDLYTQLQEVLNKHKPKE